MNVKALKEFLATLPDEYDHADILVDLDSNGLSSEISEFSLYKEVDRDKKSVLIISEDVSYKTQNPIFYSQLRLGIPEELIDFCKDNYTSPEEVLHGFIADLLELDNTEANPRADKLCRNGSDECDFANNYFSRVGYQYRHVEVE